MRPLQPVQAASPKMNETELESERRKLIAQVYAVGIAFNEYFHTGKLCTNYDSFNSTPLATRVRELGYQSIDEMLMTSGCFTSAIIQSKKHYKAEAAAGNKATQDLSSLVRRQVKKKKGPKVDTSSRQYFSRNNSRSKSFHGRPTAFGAGFTHPGSSSKQAPLVPTRAPEYLVRKDESGVYRTIHGPPKGFSLPQSSRSATNTLLGQNDNAVKSRKEPETGSAFNSSLNTSGDSLLDRNRGNNWTPVRNSNAGQLSSSIRDVPCNYRTTIKTSPPGARSDYSPAAGVKRFITALRGCGGIASGDQLRKKYRELYKVDWNEKELKKYFGMTSSRQVIETYLDDLVEITSIRGAGVRCYKLIEREPEPQVRHPQSTRFKPSFSEVYDQLISIMVDKEPEPVHLDSISTLYSEKYGRDLDPESVFSMSWKKLILEKFAGFVQLDLRGFLHLNLEEPLLKKLVMEKRVKASLEADIDSDSYESCRSSPCNSNTDLRDIPTVTYRIPKQEPKEDRTVYVDTSRHVKREIQEIKEEPLERMFDRNLRFSRSFHGRSTVTAYFGDEELSDVAGAELPSKIQKSGLRITIPGSRPQNVTPTQQQHASCSVSPEQERPSLTKPTTSMNGVVIPERPASSLSSASHSSGARERLEKTFASIGSFFRRSGTIAEADEPGTSASDSCKRGDIFHVKGGTMNGYIRYPGKENIPPERDVECAHPYFNVHVKSATGDARSLAVQRGLTIK